MSETRIYTNGAYLPRHTVGGKPDLRPFWRVGNLLLTENVLELSAKGERVLISLPQVVGVGSLPTAMPLPPPSFEEAVYLQHYEGNVLLTTAIAFPKVTVKNFPLQLAAMLTGAIRVFIPKGTTPQAGYEEAWMRFDVDRFRIQRAIGQAIVPLDWISSVTFSRARDTNQREYVEATLHYVEGSAVRSVSFLAYERTPFLLRLLGAVAGMRRNASLLTPSAAESLDETAQQVAVLLYTGGVSASSIEGMLAIQPDKLDAIYEDLLRKGLAEVVKVRKEIALTPAGMKVVDDIMKKQLSATG